MVAPLLRLGEPPLPGWQLEINERRTIRDINKQEEAWHEAHPADPASIYSEKPPEDDGPASALGGEMRLSAPWRKD